MCVSTWRVCGFMYGHGSVVLFEFVDVVCMCFTLCECVSLHIVCVCVRERMTRDNDCVCGVCEYVACMCVYKWRVCLCT